MILIEGKTPKPPPWVEMAWLWKRNEPPVERARMKLARAIGELGIGQFGIDAVGGGSLKPSDIPRRITEPFAKVTFALWLIDHGAADVTMSMDGAEPDPDEVRRILVSAAYVFEKSAKSISPYVGAYSRAGETQVVVSARPGPDVIATLSDGSRLQAECKGERTRAGVRSGTDWSGFCEVLGQLLMAVGELETQPAYLALVLPKTDRVVGFATRAEQNPILSRIPVLIALIDSDGSVDAHGIDFAAALATDDPPVG